MPAIPAAPQSRHSAVLALVVVSYLMIVIDISIVITGLPKIQQSFAVSAAWLSWVQNAYTLAFGGLLLLGARAGDILGRRLKFLAGLAHFTAASLGVGLAPSAERRSAAPDSGCRRCDSGSLDAGSADDQLCRRY